MDVEFIVNGERKPLTPQEAKVALRAVIEYRRSLSRAIHQTVQHNVRKERDIECWQLKNLGYTDAEIGRMVGITARSVRGALRRVENGRYE